MNGISVMACVQNECGSRAYGSSRTGRIQQKYIVLSSRRESGSEPVREESRRNASPETGRTADRSAHTARLLILTVLFACMIAGFGIMTRASSRQSEQKYKYYTTVTIGCGEDLSDIIYRYCDSSEYADGDAYVREICDINGLPYDAGHVPDLSAGTTIVIPYYSTELK